MSDNARAMWHEICEQPALLQELLNRREELSAPFVRLMKERPIKRAFFVGNGSPWHVGCTLISAAAGLLDIDATALPAAYFNNHGSFMIPECYKPEEVLVICPAETGHSRGQVDAARAAHALGAATMCTTLIPDGVLARECDIVLPKPGVKEVAVATTKGQSIALTAILMCFIEASHALGKIDSARYARYLEGLNNLPAHVETSIALTQTWFEANREAVMGAEQFFILGYGANWGTAQEAALKFYECHQRPTMALELEEALHGPFRALHKHDMALFICAEAGPERERSLVLADALAVYNNKRVCLRRADDEEMGPLDLPVATSDIVYLNAIEYLIPLQVLSYLISEGLGIDLSIPLVPALDPVMVPGYED